MDLIRWFFRRGHWVVSLILLIMAEQIYNYSLVIAYLCIVSYQGGIVNNGNF